MVITGGAGFIGTNLADRLLSDGERVLIFDNLSRPGAQKLYEWLRETRGLHQGLSDGARSRASAACRKTVDCAITTIDERV